MKDNIPILSIVTPSYNHGRFIEDTIRSVLCQRGDFYIDYIIMDGGSRDESISIIKNYENLLKKNCSIIEKDGLRFYVRKRKALHYNNCCGISIRWISEPDRGQSDAINKGIAMIKGDYFAWINSDDYYVNDGVFAEVCSFFKDNPEIGMAYGRGMCVDENKRPIRDYHDNCFTLAFDREILKMECDILQPTVFMRSEVIRSVGGADESFHWCMDWDLWLRISEKYRVGFIPRWIADWRQHDEIKSNALDFRMFQERFKVMRRHSGRFEFLKNKWYHLQLGGGYLEYIASLKYSNALLLHLYRVTQCILFYVFSFYTMIGFRKKNARDFKTLAVFTPLEPQKSGIATFFSKLFFSMINKQETLFIDLYVNDGYSPSRKYIHPRVRILNHRLFNKNYDTYDSVLYEMGNFNEYHNYMIPYLHRYRGTVELHDVRNDALYSKLFVELKFSIQNRKYKKLLHLGCCFPELILIIFGRLSRSIGSKYLLDRFYRHSVLVRRARRIIVRDKSLVPRFGLPIKKTKFVMHGIRIDPLPSKNELTAMKKRLHLTNTGFVVVSAGLVQKNKRIDSVLKAIARLKTTIPGILYVLAGESIWEDGGLENLIDSLGLRKHVRLTGWLSMRDWIEYISACDVGVNLRADSAGEHSGPLVTFIERGKPVLISDHDQFKIYPDDCSIKIPVDGSEVESIVEALMILYRDHRLRTRMGVSARRYAEEVLSFDKNITDRYFDVLALH